MAYQLTDTTSSTGTNLFRINLQRLHTVEGLMKFTDTYFNREERFSLGVEETSKTFYIAFPVRNDMIEHEEYYEIDRAKFELFQKDLNTALTFVTRCRHRQLDDLLIEKPGTRRETAI
jgi:hypothetical protein